MKITRVSTKTATVAAAELRLFSPLSGSRFLALIDQQGSESPLITLSSMTTLPRFLERECCTCCQAIRPQESSASHEHRSFAPWPVRLRSQAVFPEINLDIFHLKHFCILLGQRVSWLGENLHQRINIELFKRCDDGQRPTNSGINHIAPDLLARGLQELTKLSGLVLALYFGTKPMPPFSERLRMTLSKSGKRTATNEQDVAGIDLQELLLRMLSPTLRGYRGDRTFDKFQQSLLHALA